MSKIKELIDRLCPDGVEWEELGRVCEILDNRRKPIAKKNRISGIYPYYGANGIQDYINDYIFDGVFLLIGEDGSVLSEDNSPIINWAIGKIWVNNHAHVLREKEGTSLRYLYYILQTINIAHLVNGTPPKLNQQNLRSIKIPLPPIEVQEEIVRILDKMTNVVNELEAELEARVKQYEHYRDELLGFGDDVEWKNLGEICNICNGKDHKTLGDGGIPVYGSGGIMRYVNKSLYNEESVLIPRKGSLSNLFYVDRPFWNVDTIFYTIINNGIIYPKYLYYYLTTQDLERLNNAGGVPSLTQTILNQIKIPLPPLHVQEKIVSILDKFDKYCNDIKEGLPAEIELRRKQYEYYRDKLLTFKEKEAKSE